MSKITGVHHINLKPGKALFHKTVAFYRDILGLTVVRSWDEENDVGCMLGCGDNTMMEILCGAYNGAVNTDAVHHFAFQTDEVDSVLESVRSAGYHVTVEPMTILLTHDYPLRIAFFEGPNGETIELVKEL